MDYWEYLSGASRPQSQLSAPRIVNPLASSNFMRGASSVEPPVTPSPAMSPMVLRAMMRRRPPRAGGGAGRRNARTIAPQQAPSRFTGGPQMANPDYVVPILEQILGPRGGVAPDVEAYGPPSLGREFGDVMPPFGPRRRRADKRFVGY